MAFSNEAAEFVTVAQGLNELEEFRLLKDEEVQSLCKVVRHPGGTIPNPQATIVGQPATLPNPGLSVSLRAENNLKLACYFLRYRERTSRDVGVQDITLDNVRTLHEHKDWEEAHEDVDAPTINTRDWPRTIDSIEEWLRGCLGVTKIPLAYVVRESEVATQVDPVGGYPSKQDELIARAPIYSAGLQHTATYLADRARVWELLSELTRDQDCWSYVRPAQRTRDGRMAFMGLKGHYLGVNNVDNMSSKAERKLQTTTYTGEKRRWNFEKYVKVHIDQHAILEGLREHGYAGIDPRSKVRHLLAGIKTSSLDTVKTRIMSDAQLRNDFDASVNLFQDFIEQTRSMQTKEVTIAALKSTSSTKGNDTKSSIQPDMTVEDTYYSRKDYAALSAAKKLGLKIKRENRGHISKGKDRKSSENPDQVDMTNCPMNLTKRTIRALASAVTRTNKQVTFADEVDEDEDSEDDEEPIPKKQKTVTN